MIFSAKVILVLRGRGADTHDYQTLWRYRSNQMQEHQKQDLLEKWQILGLSFMMMSETPKNSHDLVKREFG